MLKVSPIFGAIIIALIELLYRYHSSWGIVLLIAIGLYVYIRWWTRAQVGEETRGVELIALMLFLVVFLGALFGMTLELTWLRHVCALGVAALATFSGSSLSALRGDIRAHPPLLVSHATLLGAVNIVFFSAFVNAFATQSQVSSWWFLALCAVLQSAMFVLSAFLLRMTTRRALRLWSVLTLITFQTAWVLAFLPFGAFTRALLLGIPAIMWFSIERDRMLDLLEPRRVLRWGGACLALLVVMLTATRWS